MSGYYCEAGSFDPQQNICPAGSKCEAGSPAPVACQQGFIFFLQNHIQFEFLLNHHVIKFIRITRKTVIYPWFHPTHTKTFNSTGEEQPEKGQATCLQCRAGFVCDQNTTVPDQECPAGKYCPEGTGPNAARNCPSVSLHSLIINFATEFW